MAEVSSHQYVFGLEDAGGVVEVPFITDMCLAFTCCCTRSERGQSSSAEVRVCVFINQL